MPRFDMFVVNILRVDEESGGHRERGVLRLVGQPAEAERTSDPHGPAENLGAEFDEAGQLRGAAREYDPAVGL